MIMFMLGLSTAWGADRWVEIDTLMKVPLELSTNAPNGDVLLDVAGARTCRGTVKEKKATFETDCPAGAFITESNWGTVSWLVDGGKSKGSDIVGLAKPQRSESMAENDFVWLRVSKGFSSAYLRSSVDGPWFEVPINEAGDLGVGSPPLAALHAGWKKGDPKQLTIRYGKAGDWTEVALSRKETEPKGVIDSKTTCKDVKLDDPHLVTTLEGSRVVCVDMAVDSRAPIVVLGDGRSLGRRQPPNYLDRTAAYRNPLDSLVLIPGEWLTVVVVNAPGTTTVVPSAGGVSLDSTTMIKSLAERSVSAASVTPTPSPPPPPALFIQHFAPRPMGKVWKLDIQSGKDAATRLVTLEIEVKNVWVGAVRLGIGASTAYDDDQYETVAYPGTGSEIVVNENSYSKFGGLTPEIVLGYSGFFQPRTYALGDSSPGMSRRWGLYGGLGVVGTDGTTIKPLTSVYAGLEWEPIPDFGIALAAVLRRGEQLNNPYQEGDRVSSDADLTSMVFRPGLGIVFNVSPAFFRAHPNLNTALRLAEAGGASASKSSANGADTTKAATNAATPAVTSAATATSTPGTTTTTTTTTGVSK